MTVFAGDPVYASDVNEIGFGREPIAQVTDTGNSSAVTAETVVQTVPSTTYKANRAYEVWIGGAYALSANTAFANFQIRKTNASGTVLVANVRVPTPGHTNAIGLCYKAVITVGGSDVTAVLVLTAAANSTNTVSHQGSATNPRHVTVRDVGPASAWPGRVVLS